MGDEGRGGMTMSFRVETTTRETTDQRRETLFATIYLTVGGSRIPFLGLLRKYFSKENESPNGSLSESASFRSRLPGSSMHSFDSNRASRDRGSAWGNTPVSRARAHPSDGSPPRGSCRKLRCCASRHCASRRAAHSRACKSQATATLCGVEVVDATRTTVGSRRLARGGVIRGDLSGGGPAMNARETSAPIMPARSAEEGGRSAADSMAPYPAPRLSTGSAIPASGSPSLPTRISARVRPAERARASPPGSSALGCWSSAWEPRSELWSPASTRSPPPSRRYDARRILPPRDTPHAAPRADSAPPRARPPVPSPDPTDRSLERTHSTLLFFSPPGSPPDSVSPNPPHSPASPRKSRRTSVSRARPRSRRPPSVTSWPPPTATRSIHPASQRSPPSRFPRQTTRSLMKIWRTISRQISRRCGRSASPDAGPRAQPGVTPSATWATG